MDKSESTTQESDLQTREDCLFANRVRTLHRQIPPRYPASVFSRALLWLPFLDILPHTIILIRPFFQILSMAGRAMLYLRKTGAASELHGWKTQFTPLTGSAWGSAAILLFPPETASLQIVLALLCLHLSEALYHHPVQIESDYGNFWL